MPSSLFVPGNSAKDFIHEVREGNIPGHTIMDALGERESIGTTTTGEDLWRGNELSNTPSAPASHVLIPMPADAGEQMSLISEDVNDTSAGSGAQIVTVHYLDGSGDEQKTNVTMNGTTAVDLAPSDVRYVHEMHVTQGNVNIVAAGNIRIYRTSDATLVYSMIAAGGNMSLVPHRMVPRAKTLYLHTWTPAEGANRRLIMRLRADTHPDGTRQQGIFTFKSTIYLNQSLASAIPLEDKVPALSVVKVSVWATAINGEASVYWWGILVDD